MHFYILAAPKSVDHGSKANGNRTVDLGDFVRPLSLPKRDRSQRCSVMTNSQVEVPFSFSHFSWFAGDFNFRRCEYWPRIRRSERPEFFQACDRSMSQVRESHFGINSQFNIGRLYFVVLSNVITQG